MNEYYTIDYRKYNDNSYFGGLIYFSDFNTYKWDKPLSNGSDIAARIMSDWAFDKQCCKNAETRDRQKNYKKGSKTNE